MHRRGGPLGKQAAHSIDAIIAQAVLRWELLLQEGGKSANGKGSRYSHSGFALGVCIELRNIGAQWSLQGKKEEEKGKMKREQTPSTDPTPPPHLPQPHEHKQVTGKTTHFSHRNKALARFPRSSPNKNKRVTTGWAQGRRQQKPGAPSMARPHRVMGGKPRTPWRASAVCPTAGG